MYYLQSRYYDPEVGRFINADSYASTGQGLLGNNMFAYCSNNPITMADSSGTLGIFATVLTVTAVSAAISGVSNAIATACNGGSLQDCLLAGIAGAIGGSVGALVAAAMGFSPIGGTIGRGVATIITDLATNLALNDKVTKKDVAWAAVDATMDMTLSTITYFYNPISNLVKQTVVNSVVDGGMDIAQTKLFADNSNTQNQTTRVKKNPRYYAHRKVGILLGIINAY